MGEIEAGSLSVLTRGHYRIRIPEGEGPHPLLIGFHGYAQTADEHLADLVQIPGIEDWAICAAQGLNLFYRRKDGVVKTHTCWDVPVYRSAPTEQLVQTLLATYHRPYHERLARLAEPALLLAVDCHTMAAFGPPVGPDPGVERPWVCLSNADGTCPSEWMQELKTCFELAFGFVDGGRLR